MRGRNGNHSVGPVRTRNDGPRTLRANSVVVITDRRRGYAENVLLLAIA